MYYKFTKLARFTIIFSMILTAVVIIYHGYNIHRIFETNELIFAKMEEMNVLRETAIQYLEKEGYKLFLGDEFATFTGILLGPLAMLALYRFYKTNSFFSAIAASFLCLLTTFISGVLLFYIIFSGKSEKEVDTGERTFKSQWEHFISHKSKEMNSK